MSSVISELLSGELVKKTSRSVTTRAIEIGINKLNETSIGKKITKHYTKPCDVNQPTESRTNRELIANERELQQESLIQSVDKQTESLGNIDENTQIFADTLPKLNKQLDKMIEIAEATASCGCAVASNGGGGGDGVDIDVDGSKKSKRGLFGRILDKGRSVLGAAGAAAAGAAVAGKSALGSSGVKGLVGRAGLVGAAGYGGYKLGELADSTETGHNVGRGMRFVAGELLDFLGIDSYKKRNNESEMFEHQQKQIDPQNEIALAEFKKSLETKVMTSKEASHWATVHPDVVIPPENIKDTPIQPTPQMNASQISYTKNIDAVSSVVEDKKAKMDEDKAVKDREETKIGLFEQIRDSLMLMLVKGSGGLIGNAPSNSSSENTFERSGTTTTSSDSGAASDDSTTPMRERSNGSYTPAKELTGERSVVGTGDLKRKSNTTNFIDWVGEADAGKSLDKGGLSVVYGQRNHGLDLTKMTVGEVREKQKTWKADNIKRGLGSSAAAGAYQVMDYTFDELLANGVVDKNDKFDMDTQRKIGKHLATQKAGRKPVRDWLSAKKKMESGEMSRAEYEQYRRKAAVSLSGEWAALPDPNRGGRSHYAGDGINGATRTLEETYDAMDKLPFSHEDTRSAQPATDTPDAIIGQAKSEAKALNEATANQSPTNQQNNNSVINNISNQQGVQNQSPRPTSIPMTSNDNSVLPTRNTDNTIVRLTDKYFSNGVV